MSAELKFCFELDDPAKIEPWGEPGHATLHWFGLTSGCYWIETSLGTVFRYTDEILAVKGWPCHYVDYQVARMFEDLQQCLPAALESVPLDIAQTVTGPGWRAREASWIQAGGEHQESRWDLLEAAVGWWQDRHIDTMHLRHGPDFHVWRVADEIHFRWETDDNYDGTTEVFAVPNGHVRINVIEFRTAAYGFCEAVLQAMRIRVDSIERNGWQRSDCALDVEQLVSEQKQREQMFIDVRNRSVTSDWENIREHLKELAGRVARTQSIKPPQDPL
jgi:hypothetical protein